MVLHVVTTPELRVEVQYDGDVVDDRSAEALADLFGRAVVDLVAGDTPCLPSFEGQAGAPPVAAASPAAPLLAVLDVARRDPTRTAVEEADRSTTYGELVERIGQVAAALVRAGVRPGDVVGLCLDRSAELAACVLAARWVGAAALCLDPEHPRARRRDLLRRSAARTVVCADPDTARDLDGIVVTDRGSPVPALRTRADDVAYVVHTSGSTGRTKGVTVPDSALATQLEWLAGELGAQPEDRVLWRTSVAFDASVWELWLPLVTGATVVVAPAVASADPEALRDLLRSVTIAQLVPTLLAAVTAGTDGLPPGALRVLAVGGEPLTAAVVRGVVRPGGPRIVNLYGPAETTVQVAAYSVRPEDVVEEGVLPVGDPATGTGLHVLSDELVELPPRAVGELYVSGPQLALGYQQDPARSAAAFVASPAGPGGGRLYRTGDLAWRGARGVVVVGRRDRQVKVRGQRIELGEIEAVLGAVPGVTAAVAVVRTTHVGTAQLAALVATDGLGEDDVRAALAEHLPRSSAPDLVVVVDALPTLVSGKPDARAAARVVEAYVARAAAGTRSESGTGEQDELLDAGVEVVQHAVAQVVGVADVGADEDLLALGVDSVSSIGIAARCRAAGLAVGPADIHTARTPREIARTASRSRRPEDPREPADAGVGLVPLTPFVVAQLGRGAEESFQVAVVRVPTVLDEVSLRTVGAALAATHDMLRARLEDGAGPGEPPHLVVGAGPDHGVVVGVRGVEGRETSLAAAVVEEVARAVAELDPRRGKVAHLRLVRSSDEALLAVVVHHLVVDAVSLRILVEDLRDAVVRGDGGALARPTTSYRTWARAVAARAARSTGPEAGPHASSDTLPRSPGPAGRRSGDLAPESTTRLLALRDVPVERVVVAALALALHRVALADGRGSLREISLEIETHGRDLVDGLDVSRTVGWFTDSRTVRVDLSRLRLGEGWSRRHDVLELVARVARAQDPGRDRDAHEPTWRPPPEAVEGSRVQGRVLVNYLGTFAASATPGEHWRVLGRADLGDDVRPEQLDRLLPPPSHDLTLDVLQRRSAVAARLEADWGWRDGVHAAPVIEAWHGALVDVVTALEDAQRDAAQGPDDRADGSRGRDAEEDGWADGWTDVPEHEWEGAL